MCLTCEPSYFWERLLKWRFPFIVEYRHEIVLTVMSFAISVALLYLFRIL